MTIEERYNYMANLFLDYSYNPYTGNLKFEIDYINELDFWENFIFKMRTNLTEDSPEYIEVLEKHKHFLKIFYFNGLI